MASKAEIGKVLGILSAAYPQFGKDVSETALAMTMRVYEQTLQDVPADVLEAAALQQISNSRFFPTVAELRERAAALLAPAERSAMEAWGEVLDTFTDGRYYRFEDGHSYTPVFDDPVLAAVVDDMGGYWHVYECHRSKDGNPTADRARFIEAYNARQKRQREERLALPQVERVRAQLAASRENNPAALVLQLAEKMRVRK